MIFLACITAKSSEIAIGTFLQFDIIHFSDAAGGTTQQHRVDCFVALCAHYFSYAPPRKFIAAELEEQQHQHQHSNNFSPATHAPPSPKFSTYPLQNILSSWGEVSIIHQLE